ncbi:MAG TPA: hypothetical protein VF174_15910 [Micromonosporaceae bacterium]
MAKQSGLGDGLLVGGYNLSGDIGSISRIGGGPAALVVTGIDKSAFERIGGVRDGEIAYDSWFNDAAGASHPVHAALPTANTLVSYLRSTTIGKPSAVCLAKQVNYDGTRGEDGSLSFTIQALANGYGVEWGTQVTAGVRSDTEATNGAAVDFAAGTSFGLQAYLQVTAFTGTDATIKLQESSDDDADTYADVTGGGFTQITAGPTFQRIATATNLTVERYLRVVTVTSAGFSALSFQVTVVRNLAAPEF